MSTHAVHMALRGQAIAALPAVRRWENSESVTAIAPGTEYVEEELVPAGGQLYGVRDGGTVKDQGLYVIRWYGVANQGTQALSTSLDALLARFPAGSKIAATDGSYVHVMGNPKPWRTQITNPSDAPGRAVSTVRVPFYVLTINPT